MIYDMMIMIIRIIFFRNVPSARYTDIVTAGLNMPPDTLADITIPTKRLKPTANPALVKL
jgi:hypothetical protein